MVKTIATKNNLSKKKNLRRRIKEISAEYSVDSVNSKASAPHKIETFINKIICGDTIDIMKSMPSESVDLIVTSPPYNLKNSTGNGMKDARGGKWKNAALVKGYSHHDDNMPHDKYVEWQRNCLRECFKSGRVRLENG